MRAKGQVRIIDPSVSANAGAVPRTNGSSSTRGCRESARTGDLRMVAQRVAADLKAFFAKSSFCIAVAFLLILHPNVADAQTPINIGIGASLTGPLALFGHQIADGTKLAIETINSQGGVNGRQLVPVIMDDGSQVPRAIEQARRMIFEDKVDALVGYPSSQQALAVKAVAKDEKKLLITLATGPELTADSGKSLLRVIGRADSLAVMVADYIAVNYEKGTVGVQFSEPNTAFDAVLRRALEAKKLNVKQSEAVPPQSDRPPAWAGEVDTVIAPLKNTLPGWLREQARKYQKTRFISPEVVVGVDPSKLIEGSDNISVISNPWPDFFPSAKAVVARAKNRGMDVNGYFLYAYAAVQVFAASFAGAKGRTGAAELFAAAQASREMDTVIGRLTFAETGDLLGWRFAVLAATAAAPTSASCQRSSAESMRAVLRIARDSEKGGTLVACIKELWAWMGTQAEAIKLVFAVIAAAYILFEYQSNLTDNAIKQTMAFQARYSERDLLKAHLDLDSMLLNPETQKKLTAAAKPSEEIANLVYSNNYERDVLILAHFFGQLATCAQNSICHVETTCAVFKSRVIALWNNYHNLFLERWGRWGENLIKPTFDYFSTTCR